MNITANNNRTNKSKSKKNDKKKRKSEITSYRGGLNEMCIVDARRRDSL